MRGASLDFLSMHEFLFSVGYTDKYSYIYRSTQSVGVKQWRGYLIFEWRKVYMEGKMR